MFKPYLLILFLIAVALPAFATSIIHPNLTTSIIEYVNSKDPTVITVDHLRDFLDDKVPNIFLNSTLLSDLTNQLFSHLTKAHDNNPNLWIPQQHAYNLSYQHNVAASLRSHYLPYALLLNLTRESGGKMTSSAHFDYSLLSHFGLPFDPLPHPGTSLLSLMFAAKDAYVPARLALAFKHEHGISVVQDCKRAATLYLTVIKDTLEHGTIESDHSKKSFYRLVEHSPALKQSYESKFQLPLELLKLKAKHDTSASVQMGEATYRGMGGQHRDPVEAVKFFSRAAEEGDPVALVSLGWFYVFGQGVEQNNRTALSLFAEAVELGSADGHAGLGYCYLHGAGVDKNYAKATDHFVLSSDKGSIVGKYWLAMSLWKGWLEPVTKTDPVLARKLFAEASASGHFVATFYLAQMVLNGEGGPASCSDAVIYLKRLIVHVPELIQVLSEMQQAFLSNERAKALFLASKAALMGSEEGYASLAFLLRRSPSSSLLETWT
ncbi:hypothetical protein RCL1_000361 [Eukaryota sp. TZLM3-RCL]